MLIIVGVVKGEINRVFNVIYSPIIAHSKWLNVPILFLLRCPAETSIRYFDSSWQYSQRTVTICVNVYIVF